MVNEPLFKAFFFSNGRLFPTALGANGKMVLKCGSVHGKPLCWDGLCYNIQQPNWKQTTINRKVMRPQMVRYRTVFNDDLSKPGQFAN